MKIYVGNIAFSSTDDDLRKAFEPFGTVNLAEVVVDRRTARSKGFGFVEMINDTEAQAAIEALTGTELGGRRIVVSESRPREERPPRPPRRENRGSNGQENNSAK